MKSKSRSWYEANHEMLNELGRKYRENMADSYVASVMRMKVSEVPQHLIELKREQLIYRRCTKQLIEALKEKKDDQ